MSRLLPHLLDHTPEAVKRLALVRLFKATTAAFECDLPRLGGMSREECLREYARFTAAQAEQALARPEHLAEVRERLFRNAYRLGRTAGRVMGVREVDGVMAVGRFLYSILDIDFAGDGRGEIIIRRCYFSRYYSPQVCELMSAMDRGLLAGLAGGGDLAFTSRITKGAACCCAHFEPVAARPSASGAERRLLP